MVEIHHDASAARTITELEGEVLVLQALAQRALDVAGSHRDRKWEELSRILQDDPHMRDGLGRTRKLIVFTEFVVAREVRVEGA